MSIESSIPLTLVVITKNESRIIRDCLQAASWIPNKVVVDCGSTDNTMQIAVECGAKVIYQKWLGYGPQKIFAVQQATTDWVLCIDADEILTPELSENIQKLFANGPAMDSYRLTRYFLFMGKELRYGESPDSKVLLFNRKAAQWTDEIVHEKVLGGSVGKIDGKLIHASYENISHYIRKQDSYTSLQAELLAQSNEKISYKDLWLSPTWRFIRYFFLKKGFKDGLPGFIHIVLGCCFSFWKYAKAYEIMHTHAQRSNVSEDF